MHDLRCGTVDAGIKVPSVENPEVTSVFPLKPREGQNIARHASPTARSSFLLLISTFPVHSPSFFFKSFPYILAVLVLANAVSSVGPWNNTGHPAQSHSHE